MFGRGSITGTAMQKTGFFFDTALKFKSLKINVLLNYSRPQ
jgi:hypothetical protein